MTTVNSTPPAKNSMFKQRVSLFRKSAYQSWQIFSANKIGVVGLCGILFFALLAVAHPILMATIWDERVNAIAVYEPLNGYDSSIDRHPSPPSGRHWLGTDPRGRDVMSQLMYSTRWEFALGLISAVVTVVIATTLGAIAAYYGGFIDTVLMRFADLIIMLPALAILIVLAGLMNVGIFQLALVLGVLGGFGGTTIVIKSQALTVKVKPFIEAARVAGGSDFHIIFKHMIPNLMPIALLYMMFAVTSAIFAEAVLSYFGLTTIEMSWGIMINQTQDLGYILRFDTWWLIFPASIAITGLCACFYMVGRALDEVVNPRLRSR